MFDFWQHLFLNASSVLNTKFQSSVSNAFLKSINNAMPGMFSDSVTFIISWMSLMF